MESDDIKLCKMQVRKVTQDVLMFMCSKQGLLSSEQIRKPELSFVPDITAEFLDNLCVLVRIQTYHNEYIWEDFLRNHFKRMTAAPYLFAKYFAYASYLLSEEGKNTYACFLEILSLAIHFAFSCWQETQDKKFINPCVDLFCAFFDMELCEKFKDQERWKDFHKYLKKYYETYLKRYNEVIHNKKSLSDVFIEFRSRHNESEKTYIINGAVLKDITTDIVEDYETVISFADFVGDKIKEVFEKAFDELLNDFQKIENQMGKLYREMAGVASGERARADDQSSSQEIQELENVHNKADPTKIKDKSKEIEAFKALEEVLKNFQKTDNQEEKLNQETVGVASGEMASNENLSSQEETLENIPSKNKSIKTYARKKESEAYDYLKARDSSPTPEESVQSTKITEAKILEAKILLKEILMDISKISALFTFLGKDETS